MVCSDPWLQQNLILQAPLQVPSAAFLCCQPAGFQSNTDLPLGPLDAQAPNQVGNLNLPFLPLFLGLQFDSHHVAATHSGKETHSIGQCR